MRLSVLFKLSIFILTPFGVYAQTQGTSLSLRLLDDYTLPYDLSIANTRVGGLSGIDYDANQDVFYIISDDRSSINPARFYTAKINFTREGKIDTIQFLKAVTLLQPNGKAYPSAKEDPANTPDPESIRYNPKTNQLVWSSEGDKTTLAHPAINQILPEGTWIATYSLPENLSMQRGEKGPRQNGTLEGLSFNPDYSVLYASMEEARYEDGPRTEVSETLSWTRLTAFDVTTRTPIAQYAYRLEPLAHRPFPSTAFAINGVTEILAWDADKILFVERSYSTGRLACTVKVFLGDLKHADNVLQTPSLTAQPPATSIKKELILNMDDLGIFIDNIEGVTFGPVLPNGNKTLIFIADNNFQSFQKNQILVIEISTERN